MGKRGSCGSGSEVPRPASPGNLEMQIPGPVPDQLNETLGVVGGGRYSVLTCSPGESDAHPNSRIKSEQGIHRRAFWAELPCPPSIPLVPGPCLSQPCTAVTTPFSHTLPLMHSSHSGPKTSVSVFVYSSSLAAPRCLFSFFPFTIHLFSDCLGSMSCVSGTVLSQGYRGEQNRRAVPSWGLSAGVRNTLRDDPTLNIISNPISWSLSWPPRNNLSDSLLWEALRI